MGNCLFMRKGETHTAPSTEILLSDIAEGSIVKVNENGSPVEFYVAKHNYESALNGEGRTLLVRKDGYDERLWHTSNVNAYATSHIDSWLNNNYKALLDVDVQTAIGTTKFYYTIGNGNTTVTTLERSILLLSITELGKTNDYAKVEGSELPISSILQTLYFKGSKKEQWTRTPFSDGSSTSVFILMTSGNAQGYGCINTICSRPCFTLPSTAVFDKTTMLLKGVA